jgi:hypothetical protein
MTITCPCCDNLLPLKPEFLGRKLKCRFCQSKFRLNHDKSTDVLDRSKRSYLGSTVSRRLSPKEVKELKEHQVEADDDFELGLLSHHDDLSVIKSSFYQILSVSAGIILVIFVFVYSFSSKEIAQTELTLANTEPVVNDGSNELPSSETVIAAALVNFDSWQPTSLSQVDIEKHQTHKAQVMKDLLRHEQRYQGQRSALKK